MSCAPLAPRSRSAGSTRAGTGGGRLTAAGLLIAALPALDALLNQTQALGSPTAEDWSLLQGVRGTLLLVLLAALCGSLRRLTAVPRLIKAILTAFGAVLLFSVINEVLAEGGLSRASLVAHGQIVYWLALWLLAAMFVNEERSRRAVLTGIVLGTAILALSVLYGYGTGERLTEKYRGVTASFGWFHSGKLIGGPLVVGGLASFYLAMRRKRVLLYATVGTAAWIAMLLTFNRAGQVSLTVLLVWLIGWQLLWGRRDRRDTLLRAVVVTLPLLAVSWAVHAGLPELETRWRDLGNADTAGSGRLVLWRIAWNGFADGDVYGQLCGVGYRGMVAAVDQQAGRPLHTHSDLFDLLLIGGVMGFATFVLFHAAVFLLASRAPRPAPEFAAGVGAALVLLSHSALTGQFLSPSSMPYYLLMLVGLGTVTPMPARPAAG